jgi:hypothetical protein
MKESERPINPILDLNQDKSGLRGLTKREYFAGLAMQGFCACPNLEISREDLAIESVRQADELLKQLQND